jgi:hypothetical protein
MPGVGVAPGFSGRLASFGSGIPGVGVAPFGRLFTPFAGMPTVEFADGGIGDVENSGGMFTLLFAALATAFVFDVGEVAHAKIRHDEASKTTNEIILSIKTKPQTYI